MKSMNKKYVECPGVLMSCICFCVCIAFVATLHAGVIPDSESPRINITAQGEQIKDIVEKISNQTGYRVEISESLLSYQVTGRYVDVDLDSFLRRIFKGMDVMQVISTREKVVKVYSSFKGKGKTVVILPSANLAYGDYVLEGGSGQTLSMLLTERDEFFKSVDVNDIPLDEDSDVTFGELKSRQALFYDNVDTSVIPLDEDSVTTPADLKIAQDKYFQSVDIDTIPLGEETEATAGSLKKIQEEFYKTVNVDDIPLDETSGVTPNSLRQGANMR